MCLRACVSEQYLQSFNILLKDGLACTCLPILDCIVQTKVNDKQEKSKFAFFPKDKFICYLRVCRISERTTKKPRIKTRANVPDLTHDRVHRIVPPLIISLS